MNKILPSMKFAPFVLPKKRNFVSKPTVPQSSIIVEQDQKYYSKNAFRYICRIAMKQGCSQDFKLIVEHLSLRNNITSKQLVEILSNAQAISGPRFFEKMIEGLQKELAKATCQYLLWFLEKRYMRYLCSRAAGRQKMTNKEQYVKFKNYVMIPMVQRIIKGL